MAAIGWEELRGQKFTEGEAREASDFKEILDNFDLEPNLIFKLFHKESLTAAKRLVLAEIVPLDEASALLLVEEDARIRAVIKHRLNEGVLNASGGIHIR